MELRERRKEETLKERLSAHYRNRDFTVKEKDANKLGLTFYWGMVIVLFFESQLILIPGLYWGDTWKMILCIALVWFTLFECVINWMGVYFGMTSFVTADVKEKKFGDMSETPSGWIHCAVCQVDAPPRSHHCKHCNRCILKRDHHCFFTNSCVGFYNQRFFMLFCFYMIWGNAYALFLQLSYLNMSLPLMSADALAYIPMVSLAYFLMGKISFLNLLIIIHACFCVMCFFGAVFFTFWAFMLASSGMTSHEAGKGMSWYGKSKAENLRSVFGSLWKIPIQLVMPLFRVNQEGDGSQWTVKSVKGQ